MDVAAGRRTRHSLLIKMGPLILIFVGILAIILIARAASNTRPKEEKIKYPSQKGGYGDIQLKPQKIDSAIQRGLISLLLKKNIIREDDLLEEIEKTKKNEEN